MSLDPDLHKLFIEGYTVRIEAGLLIVEDIPCLSVDGQLEWGALVSKLEQTISPLPPPVDHTVHFCGGYPHEMGGARVRGIQYHGPQFQSGIPGVVLNFMMSSRPDAGYPSYHAKMTTYIELISSHASVKYPGTSARLYKQPVESLADDVFLYHDTAAVRTGTVVANARFAGLRIAVVGLGGTGSYILDMVAKSRVAEIHLFDADTFDQHNAFRAPGAASATEIATHIAKVQYLEGIYSRLRRGIIPHIGYVAEGTLDTLDGMDFVFIAVDKGPVRKAIAEWLADHLVPFIDVGMGLQLSAINQVFGRCRITYWKPGDPSVLPILPTEEAVGEEEYKSALQTVEMNVINAALAILRWKRHVGFYHDERGETEALYNVGLQNLCIDGVS